MQTHVAENQAEVDWVAKLFPQARSYLDVYAQHGLLHERAVLAHGIWLDAQDRARLRDSGCADRLLPQQQSLPGQRAVRLAGGHRRPGHHVSLATDVGGGTSLSMLRTLAEAYKVQALRGTRMSAWTLLHAATRGAAESLGLGQEIGHLGSGALADVVVWDWAHGPVALHRDAIASGAVPGVRAQELHARVFAWLMLGDERNLVGTWVAGQARAGGLVEGAGL